jgi:hypothetical protein
MTSVLRRQGSGTDARHGVTHHGPYDGKNDEGKDSSFDNGTAAQHTTAKATMGLEGQLADVRLADRTHW